VHELSPTNKDGSLEISVLHHKLHFGLVLSCLFPLRLLSPENPSRWKKKDDEGIDISHVVATLSVLVEEFSWSALFADGCGWRKRRNADFDHKPSNR